jgi:hypothetical protein
LALASLRCRTRPSALGIYGELKPKPLIGDLPEDISFTGSGGITCGIETSGFLDSVIDYRVRVSENIPPCAGGLRRTFSAKEKSAF